MLRFSLSGVALTEGGRADVRGKKERQHKVNSEKKKEGKREERTLVM